MLDHTGQFAPVSKPADSRHLLTCSDDHSGHGREVGPDPGPEAQARTTEPEAPLSGLEALRAEWRRLYGPPPEVRSVELLSLMLAWRQQAAQEGGLDAATRRLLRRPLASGAARIALTGSRLIREWQGERHEVTVQGRDGYLYRGETFRSLSEVARRITGTRWNGPRFFGLRAAKTVPA